ncbi:uncharacterized protein BT62DRAFT_925442 [Guyanagaster necrorhizus]|uniref:Cytochrome c oxidase subunit 8, mitochondrial n=1 Tax=Guyanagaster necrorhizus TaxID=856835 RepID=A0A9P8AYV6_9AGAR|nr:uncharacterized protein BT62DRAFT_925442 [Guyanagaster necrorhizus MCA 3950]KAG7452900.1 hypothetical protein BT62DRAFT_925442 [Guyanagaster necrorhizus MCA 3950]
MSSNALFSHLGTTSAPLLRSSRGPIQRRFIWNPPYARPHTHVDHLPFNYLNKKSFTIKYWSYLGAGFALPWIAVAWRWYRPGGIKNP